jgi:hypothetical protein
LQALAVTTANLWYQMRSYSGRGSRAGKKVRCREHTRGYASVMCDLVFARGILASVWHACNCWYDWPCLLMMCMWCDCKLLLHFGRHVCFLCDVTALA